jgi:general secretion pathway protein L
MSTLVILLPARARLGAAGQAAPVAASSDLAYVLSPDGLAIGAQGRAAPALLPKADRVVAVVHDLDVTWHRVTLPRVPATRLRTALTGLLEEQLLDDDPAVHFAIAPGAAGGKPTWVAVLHRAWLAAQLASLEKAGVFVERVVPLAWPGEGHHGHFHAADEAHDGSSAQTWLTLATDAGLHCVRLAGGLPRALQAGLADTALRWTAAPSVAAQAERWLGAPVAVLNEPERALAAARTAWNLRQFDLLARHRGVRALRDITKRLRDPSWRPARIGLAALLVLQVAGLNFWAWSQRKAMDERRTEMVELLKTTHPQVRAVLDAPQQMRRETDALRAAAGRNGEGDLETLLAVAANAWPEGRGPADSLRFEPGRLTLSAAGWSPQQIDAFRTRLQPAGFALDAAEGRMILRRAEPRTGGAS